MIANTLPKIIEVNQADVEFVSKHLAEFFKDDPKKIGYWLLTSNPYFGEVPPAYLFFIERSHKVRQYIESVKGEE